MTAIIIPTLGSPTLGDCLGAVARLDPPAERVVVVMSGPQAPSPDRIDAECLVSSHQLGFSAAVNLGLETVVHKHQTVGLLNDDALPQTGWLAPLQRALEQAPDVGAVQGTTIDPTGRVDGRGITVDPYGLPTQIDRGAIARPEPESPRQILAASATAVLYRSSALDNIRLDNGSVFDPAFGSYHEDFDVGLRLCRTGWRALWVAGAMVTHAGSASGRRLSWRHPWWILSNRWRALAGNLTIMGAAGMVPSLLRGEIRAARTLLHDNPRVALVAPSVLCVLPVLLARAWARRSSGQRLSELPELRK